jgi:predicted nucleotidyltransferase
MSLTTEVIEPFLAKVDAAAGPGYSAVLYGSVARGENIPGLSDINLLLVLDRLTSDVLIRLEPPFSAWVEKNLPPPLLMTRAEWARASDVFPVEITDMKTAYRTLRGADPVADVVIRRDDHRRALERDFRGKLNRLRQAFVPSERDPESLGIHARQSIASVAVLYRSLLVLVGEPVPPDMSAVLARGGGLAGFDPAVLQDIAAHRGDRRWTCRQEAFGQYLSAVERTVEFVDQLQLGDQA